MISVMLGWSGPAFLFAYVLAMFAALFLSGPARRLCRLGQRAAGATPPLASSPYELACLAGGGERAIQAAVVSLAQRGVLKAAADGSGFEIAGKLPRGAHALEAELYREVEFGRGGASQLMHTGLRALPPLQARLQQAGLVHSSSPADIRCWRWAGCLPLLAVMSLGVVRAVVGVSRGRPIGFLVILLVISLLILLFKLATTPGLTVRGQAHLQEMRRRNAALGTTAMQRATQLSAADLALGVALFGAAALGAESLAWMKPLLFPTPQGSGGGDGGSSSSSGDSGGSSCGSSCGGGCGGGGCGG